MKTLLAFALVALATPALAQTAAPATPLAPAASTAEAPPAPKPATVRVTLTTAEGPILLELEKERAPVTTANFLKYVDQKRFDGAVFYRAMTLTPDGAYGLIQGGTRGNPKTTLPAIKHEPTSTTGLSHVDGTISMARGAPGSATGDFFITIGALTSLDADLTKPGDNLGFAAFGQVVEGMDVVKKIMGAPTSATEGVGVMKGQMIAAPIRIVSARRTPTP